MAEEERETTTPGTSATSNVPIGARERFPMGLKKKKQTVRGEREKQREAEGAKSGYHKDRNGPERGLG